MNNSSADCFGNKNEAENPLHHLSMLSLFARDSSGISITVSPRRMCPKESENKTDDKKKKIGVTSDQRCLSEVGNKFVSECGDHFNTYVGEKNTYTIPRSS